MERRVIVANRYAPAHEFLNPGTPDLMVMAVPQFRVTEALFNLGTGWRDHFCSEPQPLHVLPPDTPYAWRVNGKSLTVMFAFPMTDVYAILKELDAPDPMSSLWAVMDRGFIDPMVYEIIMRLWMRTKAQEPCSTLLLQSYQVAILSALTGRGGARSADSKVRTGLSTNKLNAVLDLIEARLGDDLGLPELAGLCEMSRFHFVRLFRQSTGYTPYHYLLLRRLEKARVLLISSTMPVAEVALEAGFGDAGHFSRTFARHMGTSPQRFRASVR
ncbi:AraC family transcriptional regulator [Variovorax ginsengisoli]|uniref:AraC family transcriptional regulator n=1 Tax=Variovorax ginsengisoli TaxID=363844 RepID=A0ABT8SAY0_9BURK|nr:AraC family transcriptional regulator [Variovorax ginsengisoli]MDN8616274.1 AraC family transcriptional regulator [Variovorax ginsengisoli]MDO1535444.1 AraC family transcriptional regulator [Variovorax ginsengisoli]